jgi:proteasome accessory factor C
MARHAGVDVDTLLSDLYSLAERFDEPGGYVESVSIAIETDTAAVTSSHFLRPMRLTMAELCALDLGLAMLRGERPPEEHRAIDRARKRLRNVITKLPSSDDYEGLRAAESGASGNVKHLAALRRAVKGKRKVRISYEGSDWRGVTERVAHPCALLAARGAWYVVAHCERSGGLRVFRLDRIQAVNVTAERFGLPEGFSLDAVIREGRVFSGGDSERLVVRYSPRIARWIAEREGKALAADGSVTIEHPLADVRWAVRHVLQYGPDAEVLAPENARKEIRRRLEALS